MYRCEICGIPMDERPARRMSSLQPDGFPPNEKIGRQKNGPTGNSAPDGQKKKKYQIHLHYSRLGRKIQL